MPLKGKPSVALLSKKGILLGEHTWLLYGSEEALEAMGAQRVYGDTHMGLDACNYGYRICGYRGRSLGRWFPTKNYQNY